MKEDRHSCIRSIRVCNNYEVFGTLNFLALYILSSWCYWAIISRGVRKLANLAFYGGNSPSRWTHYDWSNGLSDVASFEIFKEVNESPVGLYIPGKKSRQIFSIKILRDQIFFFEKFWNHLKVCFPAISCFDVYF